MEVWKALENKPEFLHNALNPLVLKHRQLPKTIIETAQDGRTATIGQLPNKTFGIKVTKPKKKPKVIKTPQDAEATIASIKLPTINLCKIHGVPLDSQGKCLQKGCKYAWALVRFG